MPAQGVPPAPAWPLEAIATIRALDDPQAVQEHFARAVSGYGIEFFACTQLPRPGESLSSLVLGGIWPSEWTLRYISHDYILRDPVVAEVFRTLYPFDWTELGTRPSLATPARRIMAEAAEFGLRQGFTVPLHGMEGETAVVSMAGRTCALDDPRAGAELHLLSIYTHARLRELHCPPAPIDQAIRPRLSPREQECLHWVAEGKSDWEIGEILSLSEHTVHSYIESAKRKFDVTTRIQAVVRALGEGDLRF
jgi:LuxR family quorum sensing-dependent transcriptional regulator